ncbi:Glutamate receptor ionotropic, kainate 1 [Amphibalanus amphitrite]|uniref:Glutamate receptor ionotropic, kainate 1 n=1 Tax=Amphibalanus amphitrite TaxID=1232801 RepID=A0A6A4VNT8_AMPAM|nr:Glutamate receptor ionotropic, kainate 1 [Amphibalanus amphitrite]
MYHAVCNNASSETSIEDIKRLLESSSHGDGAMNIILSDDEAGMGFIDKVNASGLFGLSDEQHEWLVLSCGSRVTDRWSRRYMPVNNHVTIAEIWRESSSSSVGDSACDSESGPVTHVELMEIYHLAPGLTAHRHSLGRWYPDTGAQSWDNHSIYERRRDFSGLTLRVATKEGAPVTTFLQTPVPDVGGYMGEIWKLLANVLNFNYTVSPSVDGEWGGLDANGRWTGLVGMLQRQEVDVSVGHLSITRDRSQVIDYTESLFMLGYSLFIKKPSTLDFSWTTYLDSFDGTLWAILCLTVLCGSASMTFMYTLERRWLATDRPRDSDGPLDTLLRFFGIACQQGADETPGGMGTRFFFWAFFLAMVIGHAAYSATLVSFLAVQSLVLPFHGLDGLLNDGTYRLGVVNGTSMYDYFKGLGLPSVVSALALLAGGHLLSLLVLVAELLWCWRAATSRHRPLRATTRRPTKSPRVHHSSAIVVRENSIAISWKLVSKN